MWDVLSGVAKMAWDVMSGVTKAAWDVLSGVANLCGMFCPGWKKMAWDVLCRDVLSGSRYACMKQDDIARVLNISQSVVSRPLKNRESGRTEKLSLCEYLMNMLRIFCELHCSQ